MNTPAELKYAKTHEWVQLTNNVITVGITDHAQGLLGDIVFVELPEIGSTFQAGQECAVVESVKSASDLYAPAAGEIIEINDVLSETPELINQSAYSDGWIFKLKVADGTPLDHLLDAASYAEMASQEDH